MSLTKRRIGEYILLNINKIYFFLNNIFAKHYILLAKQMTDKQ